MTATSAKHHKPGPARTPLHVESRPFARPEPADPTVSAAQVLAGARATLANAHGPGCWCSVWCRDDWTYADHALGECVAGDGPCRSVDPEGRLRHPNCGVEG